MYKPRKAEYLYGLLKDRIASMPDGAPFPSVRELMDEYRVSQFSVAPALKSLQEQGHLVSIVGKGSFVKRGAMKKGARIALLSPNWPSLAIAQMRDELLRAAAAKGFRCELRLYSPTEDIYSSLQSFKADGIIIDPLRYESFTAEQMNALALSCVPVVICRAKAPVKNAHYVCGDNTLAGVQAADFLIGKGHRKIGMLLSEPRVPNVENLVRGFLDEARREGCEIETLDCGTKLGEDAIAKTRETLCRRIEEGKMDFTALFVVSYETAMEALCVLRDHGIEPPEKLSLLAFGQLKLPSYYGRRPSSVGHPAAKLAEASMELMAAQLRGDFQRPDQIEIAPEIFDNGTVKDIEAPSEKRPARRAG